MSADPNLRNHRQAEQRRLLSGWFWTWPLLGTAILSMHWYEPAILRNCGAALFIPGLIGTTAAAWTIARTKERIYWAPCIVSAILLTLGAWRFWMVAP
jgi:hypothetical protein